MDGKTPVPPILIRKSLPRAVPLSEFYSPPLFVLLRIEIAKRYSNQRQIFTRFEVPHLKLDLKKFLQLSNSPGGKALVTRFATININIKKHNSEN